MVRSPHAPVAAVGLGASLGLGASTFIALRNTHGQVSSAAPTTSPLSPSAIGGDLAPGLSGLSMAGLGMAAAVAFSAARRRSACPQARIPMTAAKEAAVAEGVKDVPPPPPPPFDPAKQLGAMAPMGYFDPLGFSKVGDEAGFRNLRSAEIKHGRVAMMAAVGGVAQHYIKFPGFEKVPAGLGAIATAPGTYGFVALFLLAGALELVVWTQDPKKEPGNFGDPLGLGMYDDEMRSKELNNGRFAMFAALGIVSADLLTGKDAIQQLGL